MVEYIEELGLYSELHPLAHRKRFREIEVIPDEIGATQGVAAEVSELATLWVVATGALPRTRTSRGNKRGRIEPLEGARLRYTGDGMMLIEGDARNDACELRSAALHNAVSIGRIGCAQNGERHPTVPEHGSGNLPAVEHVRQLVIPKVGGQLINILRVEVVTGCRSRKDRNRGSALPAAEKESLPQRTEGILRSKPYPCSGSTCS